MDIHIACWHAFARPYLLISQATRPFISMTSEGLANPRRLRTLFLHLSLSICRTVRAFFSSRLAVRTSAAIWNKHILLHCAAFIRCPLGGFRVSRKIQRINCTLTWPHKRSSWQSSDTSLSQRWSGYLLPAHIHLSVIHLNLKPPEHCLTLQSQKS